MKFCILAIVSAVFVHAQDCKPNFTLTSEDTRTNFRVGVEVNRERIDRWLKRWQKLLLLENWKIDIRVVHSSDLKPETLGNLKWNVATHTATIKVLHPCDYTLSDYTLALDDIPEDIEFTIVHELVHLQLSTLPRDLNKKDVEETVVNKFSDAFMSLDKGPTFRARSVPPPKQQKIEPATAEPIVSRVVQN